MYGSQNVQNVSNGCKVEHKGTAIKGVPGLFGSSYRHGLSDDDSHIFVLLEDKLLEDVLYIKSPCSTVGGPFDPLKVLQTRSNFIFWPWTDGSTPRVQQMLEQVKWLAEQHKNGESIEVACYGGHGRTGTLLAILAALSTSEPTLDAIDLVKADYCNHAVETKTQEETIIEVLATIRGEPIPQPSPKSVRYSIPHMKSKRDISPSLWDNVYNNEFSY